jgi:arylsulfatase A-like enzyme
LNIIFLTVDALRADRCSVNGYARPTTPTLERLAARGINCTQAVSPGAFTHICFPSIMTSSRPLSYGGYDSGTVGRRRRFSRKPVTPGPCFRVLHHALGLPLSRLRRSY